MVTLRELHDDPAKMAEFMGWPFEDDVVITYHCLAYGGHRKEHRRERTAVQATKERYDEYRRQLDDTPKERSWDNFVRECAHEEYGIRGRTVEEVRKKCIEAYPEIYCEIDGEFAAPQQRHPLLPDVPPPPKRMR